MIVQKGNRTLARVRRNHVKSTKAIHKADAKSSVLGNAIAATRFSDAFSNHGARTGFGEMNLVNMTEYPLTRLTQDWSLLTSLYRSSWIVQRVCSIIPEDALTDMHIEAPGLNSEAIARLDEELRRTKARRKIIDALKWARLYGGAAAIMMVDGQDDDLSKPLSVNRMLPGSFRGLFVVDRWSGIYPSLELVSNRASSDFGLPRYYEVRDESGVLQYRVHHSRVLRFVGTDMPYYEEIAEQHWGTSAIESLYDDLVRRDNIVHNIANLTFKACLSVYEIENLDQIFASAGANAQRRMYSMIQAMSILESNLGVKLVNKGDGVQQLQYAFSGLPEVLDGAMLDVSGSTSIPATRLFGRSPAGMNATGESDEKMYRSTLEQQRATHIIPVLEKLCPVVCKSALGGVPSGAEFKLPPLEEMSPNEKAEVIDKRLQPLERLFALGMVPADAVLEELRNTQIEMNMTATINDKTIDAVRGKYQKDLAPQNDPFGGIYQADDGEPIGDGTDSSNSDVGNKESHEVGEFGGGNLGHGVQSDKSGITALGEE